MYDDDYEHESEKTIANIKYTINCSRVIGSSVYPTKWDLKSDVIIYPPYNHHDDETDETVNVDDDIDDDIDDSDSQEITDDVLELDSDDSDDSDSRSTEDDAEPTSDESSAEDDKAEDDKAEDDEAEDDEAEDDEAEDDEAEDDSEIAGDYDGARIGLAKVKFWMENVVNGCIVFSIHNKWARRAFFDDKGRVSVKNQIMILPMEPTDEILAQIFQSKLNALAGDNVEFGSIDIESNNDAHNMSYIFYGDGELALPSMEEWMGSRHWFSKPWWARDDASTYDITCPEDADLDDPPKYTYKLDFLADMMKPPVLDESNLICPEFRPQLVKDHDDQIS